MHWGNFLHFYQPSTQQKDILESIVVSSYRPVLEGLKKARNLKTTVNIAGALLELFDKHGYHDLIDLLILLVRDGRVEITGTSKYHTILPLVPEEEMYRQIRINDEAVRFFLGKDLSIQGFFPPEMAVSDSIIAPIAELGYKWIIADELSCKGGNIDMASDKLYKISKSELNVFFRNRRVSNMIMGAISRNRETLRMGLSGFIDSTRYLVSAMDAETFGHHRIGHERFLLEVMDSLDPRQIKFELISELLSKYDTVEDVDLIPCTWASSANDLDNGSQFLSWRDKDSTIHGYQWELLNLVLDAVHETPESVAGYDAIRRSMDEALSSDQFFWASGKPWWSLEMIEVGAYRLLETMSLVSEASEEYSEGMQKARHLYQKIISTAFEWQRSGKIRKMAQEQNAILRIPFKKRTLEAGGSEVGIYEAFIAMMKDLEKKAVGSGEYEKAILWRDAIYKIEHKLDIYDAINAIDLLRQEIPNEEVEKTLDQYTAKYKEIRGGQPEQRGS